jgi:hypothetical protein
MAGRVIVWVQRCKERRRSPMPPCQPCVRLHRRREEAAYRHPLTAASAARPNDRDLPLEHAMAASFSSRIAAAVILLAARSAHAQGAPPAPQQPYAPYAAYPAPAWAGGTMPVPIERQSPGMMTGGIVLIAIGSTGSIVGAALLAAGTGSYAYTPCPPGAFECYPVQTKPGLTAAGATIVAVSTAALIVGIPLLAVGMRKVPVSTGPRALVPELRVGATGGTLRWEL